MSWFELQNPDTVPSPALLVYPDRVRANIRRAVGIAGDVGRFRPHVKTHKMRAVTELLLAEGVRKFKCATLAEAEMLADAGAPDVLLAYPVVGPNARRLHALRRRFPETRFAGLVDSAEAARHVAEVFADAPLDVYVDLNVGMDRTGVAPADAHALVQQCQALPGLRVAGLHAYDGHIRETDLSERRQQADRTASLVESVQRIFEETHGQRLPVVMGGSPPFTLHAQRSGVEVSPGTFVFWDAGYARSFPDLPFEVAAVLLTRVISIIDDHTLCLDLGHKAVAAENPLPRVVFLNHPDVRPVRQSEEHLVVEVFDARAHAVGEAWYGVPIHICPTVALYDEVFVVENGEATGTWPVTARGRTNGQWTMDNG